MLKSLLGAVEIDSLILDVFIILAVVVAGALIVYLLWETVSSIINKNKNSSQELDLGEKTNPASSNVMDYSFDAQEEKVEEEEAEKESVKEEPVVVKTELLEESKITEVDEAKAEEEKEQAQAEISEEERLNAERRAYLEARRQELIRRMQNQMKEKEEKKEEPAEEEPVEEEEVVEEKEEQEEVVEETVAPQPEPVAVPVVEEQTDNLEEERKALTEERERYEVMIKELERAKQALAEQKVEVKEIEVPVPTPVLTNGVLSLEELKERLADAEQKLKATEKEFRQCKKEYIPLRRVWNTHEKDERKLRRKEALVAKQKVILYGVNNYADIDEEKAKKLAEDLDLLDGLKLSVQHCEEVMQKNAERYPLLQKMYNVLSARNEELKNDIAYYKQEIEKLEAEQAEGSDGQSEE